MKKTILLGASALLLGIATLLYLNNIYTTATYICVGVGFFLASRALFPNPPK